MRTALLLVFLISAVVAGAQKTEKYFNWKWQPCEAPAARYYTLLEKKDGLWNRKDYFINEKRLQMEGTYQDEASSIPEGLFHYYHANGILASTGKYHQGKKVGTWLSYHSNGMMSDSAFYEKGNITGTRLMWYPNGYLMDSAVWNPDGSGVLVGWFDNGEPAEAGRFSAGYQQNGKWNYYHRNGKLSSVEIYQEGNLKSRQYYTETGEKIMDTTCTDKEASFPGGLKAWQNYVLKKTYFPTQYQFVNTDQAVVVVEWTIDEEGKIKDVFVSDPLHPAFDKVARAAIMESPRWIPARSHNRNISSKKSQPITFLQD